jgi:hypothetical protein
MRKKGIPEKSVLVEEQRKLTHKDFYDCLMGKNEKIGVVTHTTLKSTKTYGMETKVLEKKGLSALDDKSYYFNETECLRYGHYQIDEARNMVVEEEDEDDCDLINLPKEILTAVIEPEQEGMQDVDTEDDKFEKWIQEEQQRYEENKMTLV